MIHIAYVGVGANLGDPVAQVRGALRELERLGSVRASSLYRTEPVGNHAQPWFVNAVAEVRTGRGVDSLFRELRVLEQAAGRPSARRSGSPRTLDLDLLLYDDLILEKADLVIPHPRFHERRFALEPLAEIAPDARDPRSNLTAVEMLRALQDPALAHRLPAAGAKSSGSVLGTLGETPALRRATT
jgi:2-amino-4-hydroxy-6-hydroxymethyldihydropteridine diphosphokinase